MNFFYYAVVAVFLLSHRALPFSIALSQNLTQQELPRRAVPSIPPRPAKVGNQTFHTSQFDFFEETGFVPGSPAVETSPVFLFGRAKRTFVSVHVNCASNHPLTLLSGSMLSRECCRDRIKPPEAESRDKHFVGTALYEPWSGLHKSRDLLWS